jgi:hypothetical protein
VVVSAEGRKNRGTKGEAAKETVPGLENHQFGAPNFFPSDFFRSL